jgi:hypothetical protein
MSRLDELWDDLRSHRVDLDEFSQTPAAHAAASLMFEDSQIAGLVSRILSGESPLTAAEKKGLEQPSLLPGARWITMSGKQFDLTPYPELLRWAQLLESIRVECLKHLG